MQWIKALAVCQDGIRASYQNGNLDRQHRPYINIILHGEYWPGLLGGLKYQLAGARRGPITNYVL